jgi:cytochrome b
MVWFIWTLVLLLGLTGWMSRLDALWDDDSVHAVHSMLADTLTVAVCILPFAVAGMSWLWRENLVIVMINGWKRR